VRRRNFLQRLLWAPVAGLGPAAPAAAQPAGQAVLRRLRFSVTFSNPLDRRLERQRFWCYLPASAAAGQSLREVQVSAPYRLQADALEHRILELWFDNFPPLAQQVVTLTAVVELDPTAALRRAVLPGRAQWLAAERYIESEAAPIRALAEQLWRADELAGARAIYDWVRGNMRYAGYLADEAGALQGLRALRGDCTEYADLVVALARANGLPARMVGGYVSDRDLAPRPRDYHNWAEVYLDGGWRVVDAQKENWLPPPGQYVAFRIYRDAPVNPVGLAHRYRLQGELEVLL
jgi:hypothetical protein